jgi:hypothetical protein
MSSTLYAHKPALQFRAPQKALFHVVQWVFGSVVKSKAKGKEKKCIFLSPSMAFSRCATAAPPLTVAELWYPRREITECKYF